MSYRCLIVSLFLAGSLGSAQNAQSAAMQRMQQMSQQLQLTEQQKEKIMPILISEAPKAKAVKSDPSLPDNEKVAKLLEIRNESDDNIRPMLTSGQQKKLDQMRQQQRQQVMHELQESK